jgi:hypothetical protein
VLLVGAALLARSFVELVRVDAGYDPANVLTADVPCRRRPHRGTEIAISRLDGGASCARFRGARSCAGDMAPFGSMLSGYGFRLPGLTARMANQ